MAASRCPVREDFDPLAPEFLADPYAVRAGAGAAGSGTVTAAAAPPAACWR